MGSIRELPPPRGMLARLRGVPPSQLRRYEIRPRPLKASPDSALRVEAVEQDV
jgi:hypothetical protein